jgi:glycosyltransferase involved in cell wall biosynthesis
MSATGDTLSIPYVSVKERVSKMRKGFSIIIATWNNLDYIRCLLYSIRKNSIYDHQVIIHVNDGSDGTLEWATNPKTGVDASYTTRNVGLPKALNIASKKAKRDWICHIDDDMYVLPYWDEQLVRFHEINELDNKAYLTSTMIEPTPGPPWTITPFKFGKHPSEIERYHDAIDSWYKDLQQTIPTLVSMNATPLVMSREMWEGIGGADEAFSPAIGFEEGLAKRCWDYGCRLYDYASHARNREEQFLRIHGMTTKEFRDNLLHRGDIWTKQKSL